MCRHKRVSLRVVFTMSLITERLSARIREYRTLRGLSQEQLALKANINVSFLGQIERGTKKPTIETIDKILNALDVSYLDFFNFETKVNDNKNSDIIDKISYELKSRSPDEQQLIYDIMRRIFVHNDYKKL